jgi:hypothetical protein
VPRKANLSRDASNKCGVLPVLPRELGGMPRHDNPEPTAGGHDRYHQQDRPPELHEEDD